MYDTVTTEEGSFIKVMNVGERIEVNRIEGVSHLSIQLTRRIPAISVLFLPNEHPYKTADNLLCTGRLTFVA